MTTVLTAFRVSLLCRPEAIGHEIHAEGLLFEASMLFSAKPCKRSLPGGTRDLRTAESSFGTGVDALEQPARPLTANSATGNLS
jgi:hypothetical protein